MPSQPPFTILLQGHWHAGQVEVVEAPSTRRIVPAVEQAIDRAWQSAATRPGVSLFDGPMCRLESFTTMTARGRLHLAISRTSYKPFLGTNLTNTPLADAHGPDVLANPLGASVALVAADGMLLLGHRGPRVAYYPNRVHPFAGSLDPDEASDVFSVVYRELSEELSLARDEVMDVALLGLAQDDSIRQPELIFAARTPLDSRTVASRLDASEHDALWPVAAGNSVAVDAALSDPMLTPIARATITMWRDGV
jgi:8-oxo-dGTP pyrophosphatase MutT (NUDIX family)